MMKEARVAGTSPTTRQRCRVPFARVRGAAETTLDCRATATARMDARVSEVVFKAETHFVYMSNQLLEATRFTRIIRPNGRIGGNVPGGSSKLRRGAGIHGSAGVANGRIRSR